MGRGRPYYQQMRDDIKKKIQCGDYKRGQYLPCEKKLVEEYGVSRTTVRSAISELVQDGYLYIVRGKGTKVAYSRLTDNNPNLLSFTEIVKSHGYEPQMLQRSFEIIRADEKLAKKLGIGAGEEAVHIYRVRGTDDEPVSINDSYLPGKILGEQGAELLLDGESMYENLKRHYHIAVTEVKEEIWAVSAGKYEAETLDVEENAPLLAFERESYSQEGTLVEYSKVIYRSDRYRHAVVMRRREE